MKPHSVGVMGMIDLYNKLMIEMREHREAGRSTAEEPSSTDIAYFNY